MPIGVKGQYTLKFSVAGNDKLKDFIKEPDLITFKLIEEAGNLLPIYELVFYSSSEDIFNVLHEGNDLDCTMGKDDNDKFTCKLTITTSTSSKSGVEKRVIRVTGLYSVLSYVTNSKMFISDNKSAVEVLTDKAIESFGSKNIISNIEKSHDKQRWIQPNSSDKTFLNELWLHANLPNSFLAIGVSSDGKFIIKDMLKDIQGDDKTLMWRFVTDSNYKDKRDIVYNGDAVIETNTGFVNSWMGYGRELYAVDLDTSFDSKVLELPSPMIAMSSRMAKRIEIDKKFASMGFQNENTHESYWQSYMHNLTSLASFQNIKITFTFQSQFKFVRILDKVYFKENSNTGSGSSEYSSGIYYVTKVSRNITNRMFSTTIVLNREALNAVKTSN